MFNCPNCGNNDITTMEYIQESKIITRNIIASINEEEHSIQLGPPKPQEQSDYCEETIRCIPCDYEATIEEFTLDDDDWCLT